MPASAVCLCAAGAQPTGADPLILMVETYSERADAIQNMAIRGSEGTFTKPNYQSQSPVGVRGEDLIPDRTYVQGGDLLKSSLGRRPSAGTVEGDGMWTAIAELLFPSSVFSDTVSEPS